MLDTGYWILDNLKLRTSQNVIEYRESNIEYQVKKTTGLQLTNDQ
jgi:hypothetical protein